MWSEHLGLGRGRKGQTLNDIQMFDSLLNGYICEKGGNYD